MKPWLCFASLCSVLATGILPVDSLSSPLTKGDREIFERSYESEIENLIRKNFPDSEATVSVSFNYSENPSDLQSYFEALQSRTLPGLPQVTDPFQDREQNQAIEKLVTLKTIQVFFQKPIESDRRIFLEKLLKSKLKLGKSDDLTISVPKAKPDPTRKAVIIGFGISALATLSFLAVQTLHNRRRRKKLKSTKIPLPQLPNNTHLEFLQDLSKAAFAEILDTVGNTKIAQSLCHSEPFYRERVIEALDGTRATEISDWLSKDGLKVTPQQSEFARVFIAAKAYQHLKAIMPAVDFIQRVEHERKRMKESQGLILEKLKPVEPITPMSTEGTTELTTNEEAQ